MKLNAPLFPIALCLMVGIGFGKNLESLTIAFVILIPLLIVTALARKWPKVQTAGILVCVVLLGMILGKGNPNRNDGRWIPEIVYQRVHNAKVNALKMRAKLIKEESLWDIDEGARGVIAAMTLGDKTLLDRDVKDTYRKVGVAHVLALSGLHMMMIYVVVTMVIGWWRYRLLKQVVTVLSMWAFAFLVGLSPSVVRSAVMISIYALLSLGYREKMSVNTLAFTAIVMLVLNPKSLDDVGFQLSFMAVLAILVLNPLFAKVIPLHVLQEHRWLKAWWGLTTVSISAQVGTAPLVAYYFGTFSTYFLLGNYLVVPLATVVLYLTLACFVTCWWTGLQQWLVAALGWVVGTMNRLLEMIGALPKSNVEGINLSTLQLYLIYILISSLVVLLSLWVNSKYVKQLTKV
jgi:competence protein ComEC